MLIHKLNKFLIPILVFAWLNGYCQFNELSPKAEVSIITFGVGQDELYAAFGHNAIRVYDPDNELDACYNYGAFNFNQPNFYLNYTKGLLNFMIAVNQYSAMRDAYIFENRSVEEQVLDLTQVQKQRVFEFLVENALPENSEYRYDYFFNNCATKVRDVFVNILKDSIRLDSTFIKTDYSFRQIELLYLPQQPWGDLGINICLGSLIDKKITKYQYMFIPEYLKSYFDLARINKSGKWVPLVKEKIAVYNSVPESPRPIFFQPWTVFTSFLFITILLTFYDWKRKRISKWFDLIVFSVMGILGIFLLLLWMATDHWATAKNYNLLWALPTNIFVFMIFVKRLNNWSKIYFSIVGAILIFTLAFWFFLPQQMNNSLILILCALIMRAFLIVNFISKDESSNVKL